VDNVRAAGVDQIGLITENIPDAKKLQQQQQGAAPPSGQ
jgi:hypothetical protein